MVDKSHNFLHSILTKKSKQKKTYQMVFFHSIISKLFDFKIVQHSIESLQTHDYIELAPYNA